jgi:hypothetical protein
MIYNVYNEVMCDFNCSFCEIINDCSDRIEKPEEEPENNKIVVFNNFENIIIL